MQNPCRIGQGCETGKSRSVMMSGGKPVIRCLRNMSCVGTDAACPLPAVNAMDADCRARSEFMRSRRDGDADAAPVGLTATAGEQTHMMLRMRNGVSIPLQIIRVTGNKVMCMRKRRGISWNCQKHAETTEHAQKSFHKDLPPDGMHIIPCKPMRFSSDTACFKQGAPQQAMIPHWICQADVKSIVVPSPRVTSPFCLLIL